MKRLFLAKLALLNLLTKRLRTGLTVGGIGLSVGVMIFLLGLGDGLQNIVTTEIARSGTQETVTVASKRTKQLKLDSSAISRLTSISGVSEVEQQVGLSGRVTYHGISLDMPVYAVSRGYLETTVYHLVAVDIFTTNDPEDKQIILSTRALQALGITSAKEAVGKTVEFMVSINKDWATNQEESVKEVTDGGFRIVGVFEKGGIPVAYTPLQHLQPHGVNVASEVALTVNVPDKIKAVRETVEQLGFQTSSIRDTIDQVNRIFAVIQTILIIFGVITLIIAVFGTLNTITISLVEQTRQVGFLRILGISKQDVQRLFMLQSILLSLVGVSRGIVLGLLLGALINGLVWIVAQQNGNPSWQLYQAPVLAILLLLASSVALGWVLGLGPARRAVNLRPLEALRV